MTNKTITLPVELVQRAVSRPGKESLAVNSADIIDRGRAQAEIRDLLAEPVPPSGGDKPALYLDARGFEIMTRCLTVSACIDVSAHHSGELFDHYRPDGLVPVYSEETVTRLRAEVERLGKRVEEEVATAVSNELKSEREVFALQSELTKARELAGTLKTFLKSEGYGDFEWKELLSNQADKGRGEPVAVGRVSYIGNGFVRVRLTGASPKLESLLYAERPAPVAVVMPGRLAIQSHWPEWKISGSEGWNACLDEFARLNSEPKP